MSHATSMIAASLLAACAVSLAGCDQDSFRGTRGLKPAPAVMAYPNIGVTPPQRAGRLRSTEQQKQLEAELLARGARRR